MTITLAVHPLRGVALPVVRDAIRFHDGRRMVEAMHPSGWTIRLPIEWTDRWVGAAPLAAVEAGAKLSLDGLVRLARVLEPLDVASVDVGVTSTIAAEGPDADIAQAVRAATRVDGAVGAESGQPGGRVGRPGPRAASCRRGGGR